MQKQIKKPARKNHIYLITAIAGVLSSAAPDTILAASDTWSGGTSSTWSTSTNWVGGNVPGSGDVATFNLSSSNPTLSLGSGVTINQLQFDAPTAASYAIGAGIAGSEKLTINSGGGIAVSSTVTNPQTINAAIQLGEVAGGASFTITNDSAATLTLKGAINENIAQLLTFGGSGTILLTQGILDSTHTTPLTKTGSGTLVLTGNNTYSSDTKIVSGTLQIGNGSGAGSLSSNIVNSGNLVFNWSSLTSFTRVISGTGSFTKTGIGTAILSANNTYTGTTFIKNGTLQTNTPSGIGTIGDIVFLGGALSISTTTPLDYSSRIHNSSSAIILSVSTSSDCNFMTPLDSSNTGGLTKKGAGTLTLSAANVYSGITSISTGSVRLNHPQALGPSASIKFTGGTLIHTLNNMVDYASLIHNSTSPITIDTNGQTVQYSSAIDLTNTGGFTKTGEGTMILSGNNAYSGTTNIQQGTIRLDSVGALGNSNGISFGFSDGILQYSAGNNIDYSSKFNDSQNPLRVDTNGQNITFASTFPSQFGPSGFYKYGKGTLTIAANDFVNGKIYINEGTLQLGTGGTLGDLNNYDINVKSGFVNNGTLVINHSNNDGISLQPISGTGSFTKLGTGQLTFLDTNTYTGTTYLNGGSIEILSSQPFGKIGDLIFGGGALAYTHPSYHVDLSSRIHNSTSPIIINTNDQNITYASVIDSTNIGGLTKLGASTLSLKGNNTFSGPVTIGQGLLVSDFGLHTNSSLAISGTLEITKGGTDQKVTSIAGLTISGSGRLVLHDNDLILAYTGFPSSYATTVNKIKSGLVILGGAGTSGITSPEIDNQTVPGTMLAVVDGGNPFVDGVITSISGYSIAQPKTSVLVKFTWFGDSNLDGLVDGSDYALLDSGFSSSGTRSGWLYGDYDYNGTINDADYALIDTGFVYQTGALPEPAMLGLILLSGAGLLRRRR